MKFSIDGIQRRSMLQWAAASSAATLLPALAQSSWPTKPVTMVVPFPAGGGTDAFARPLSAIFSKQTGKQLIIDNRGGAGGGCGRGDGDSGIGAVVARGAAGRLRRSRFGCGPAGGNQADRLGLRADGAGDGDPA